ncbi:MAG: T9SS type A sorting domain-containing protein [candidate division Zixibacteria bacterium]|nr:T9SS type A sorting domain-containing protein [candidate division Zixibacteria bacterium]
MQSLRKYFSNAVLISIVFIAVAHSQDSLPQPEFDRLKFLRYPAIDKMTMEMALELSNRHASFFLAPFDAVVLHTIVDNQPKDVFIISDIGQRRLTIWLCSAPDGNGEREIEAVKAYYGEGDDTLIAPSGMDTNAKNRQFIGGLDLIYLADRGNSRIIEYTYNPDKYGGELVVNRMFESEQLHYPMDVAISAYGNKQFESADLYVVDAGTFNGDGKLVRFGLNGSYEGAWSVINFPESEIEAAYLDQPISVACYPDTSENISLIYIVEADNNLNYILRSATDKTPEFVRVRQLPCDDIFCQSGGIALDDYGRIYQANNSAGKINMYGPYFYPKYESYGKPGIGEGELNYPVNLIIDTYYNPAEALVIETYDRFSGFQSFTIAQANAPTPPPLGFGLMGLPKRRIGTDSPIPGKLQLSEAYPNPFNSNCVISFSITAEAQVKIEIFNVLGQVVATPLDKEVSAGTHSVKFNADNLSSGIYFYKVTYNGNCQTKKLVLLK